MPNVKLRIGGRSFEIECGEGQEEDLLKAAGALDRETKSLKGGSAHLNEKNLLLISGLLVANKHLERDAEIQELRRQNDSLKEKLGAEAQSSAMAEEERERLRRIADKSEGLALKVKELADPEESGREGDSEEPGQDGVLGESSQDRDS